MPKGGARVNSGPPPDPNALRRERPEDKAGWTLLPASGRSGDVPLWPLPPDVRLSSLLESVEAQREVLCAQIDGGDAPRGAHAKLAKLDQTAAEVQVRLRVAAGMEADLWSSIWTTPQSVVWESLRWTREVAIYVRWQVLGELGDLDAAKEARQWSDRLGLNPAAMLRNRWKIAVDAAPVTRRTTTRTAGARERFKVVEGGA